MNWSGAHIDRGTIATWTVWVLMLTAGLWLVAAHAFTMPYGDEWAWLPVIAGQQPVDWPWLWSMHNEHRMPLPRLIYLGLGTLSGYDFRCGALVNILALGGLALALMLTARSVRGRTSIYDAFFPLLLMHWGQCENIIWGFQLNFIASVVFVGIILSIVVRCGPRLTLSSALLVTACLVGTGLCGLYGLVYLPAMAAWLAFAGVCRWRGDCPNFPVGENGTVPFRAETRPAALLLLALAAVPLLLVALYFVGYHGCHDRPPNLWASLRTSVQFLSSGIGPAAKEIWPVSGLLILVACGYSVWQLLNVFRRQPEERLRAAGLFCFLGGVGALALAIGVGRAFAGPRAGFMERYTTLAAPLLCLFYLQFTLYSTKAKIHLQRTLCLLMCGLLVVNVHKGLRYAHYFDRLLTPLEADMRAGLSPADLALRHGEDLAFAPNEVFAARLEMLRDARLGPYRDEIAKTDRLAVQCLSHLAPSREPVEQLCLLPGHSLTQCFDIPIGSPPSASVGLSRIDVKISRCRGRHTSDRLNWHLYLAGPGPQRPLAHGSIDMASVGRNDYVSLTIDDVGWAPPTNPQRTVTAPPPLPLGEGPGVRAAQRYAMVFSLPPETAPETGVELPLFPCANAADKVLETDVPPPPTVAGLSLKGFLFLSGPHEQ